MNRSILTIALLLTGHGLLGQELKDQFTTTDIDNYWVAYDRIIQTSDSLERIKLIHELYMDKGTDGLKSLIAVRGYQDHEYVNNILNYPKYWNSIRVNTSHLPKYTEEIENHLAKLKEIYPELKPAKIYLSIGAFRTGGTYDGDKVLLGGEYMLAQGNSNLEELPERVSNTIQEYAPFDIPLTAIHEYIHTQQKP